MDDLFSHASSAGTRSILGEGVILLTGFARAEADALIEAVTQIELKAPFRRMTTPGGYLMSVAMTNCGSLGWLTDRRGYRYDAIDPLSSDPWPEMPMVFRQLATRAATAAGYDGFAPDACLLSRYEPTAQLSLHQDRNEHDFSAPIVSVSLGLPATFLFGGLQRNDRARRIRIENGDVVIWGGKARLAFHGIAPLADGLDPLTGRCRINLSFRKVN